MCRQYLNLDSLSQEHALCFTYETIARPERRLLQSVGRPRPGMAGLEIHQEQQNDGGKSQDILI